MASAKALSQITVLMADDDPEDCLLTQEAWEEWGSSSTIRFVRDGVELMDYLHHRGRYANPDDHPLPGMILLDLNMPRKTGHEVLKEIKEDETLRHIPVFVLTSSIDDIDTYRTYTLGAQACLTKPQSLNGYRNIIETLGRFGTPQYDILS